MKIVLEVDLTDPQGDSVQRYEIEREIADLLDQYRLIPVAFRWAEVDEHPPRFSRARESKPMVVGEQLILDREYRTVDL